MRPRYVHGQHSRGPMSTHDQAASPEPKRFPLHSQKATAVVPLSELLPSFRMAHRGRLALFIDGSNLFYAALNLGIELDYTRLLRCLTAGSRLLRPYFYTGVDPANEKQQSFLLWMRRNGYRVVTKELVQAPDCSKKADLSVELTVDMLMLAEHYDTAILVSGNGDLAYAANAVSRKGAQVEIVSLRSMTSDSLLSVADRYIDLALIKHDICRLN